jgi:hypothetical protein
MTNQIFDRDDRDPHREPDPEPRWLTELRRRDWAVRVLDAWAVDNRHNVPYPQRDLGGKSWTLFVYISDERGWFTGPTPDAARLAAALAVYPTLDAATHERLGACPT